MPTLISRFSFLVIAAGALLALAPLAAQGLLTEASNNPDPDSVAIGANDHLCLAFELTITTAYDLVEVEIDNDGTAGDGDWTQIKLVRSSDEFVLAVVGAPATFPVTLTLVVPQPLSDTPTGFEVRVNVPDTAALDRTFELVVHEEGITLDPPHPYMPPGAVVEGGAQTITAPQFTQIFIDQQPEGGTGGSALDPAPVVELRDPANNLVEDDDVIVTAAIVAGTGPDGAQIVTGATTLTVGGVATFGNLAIDLAGEGYRLVFSALGVNSPQSDTFSIVAGAPHGLQMISQPGGAVAARAFVDQPTVRIVDAGGNPITADNTTEITASIIPGTGNPSATLGGNAAATAQDGVAEWDNLAINLAGPGYQLMFEAAGLEPAVSAAFEVVSLSGDSNGGGGCALRLGSGQAGIPASVLLLLAMVALLGPRRRRGKAAVDRR